LKNFNHVVKEILEKDLDLDVDFETVNTLKNEFLADLPSSSAKPMISPQNKENIDYINRGSVFQSKEVDNDKESKMKNREAVVTPKNNDFRSFKTYHHYHQPKNYNATQNRNSNFWKERTIHQSNDKNGIPVFYNKNSYFNKKENFNRVNRKTNSPSEIQGKNGNNFGYYPQEKSIYNTTVDN
jgi:hypothetical protein